MDRRLKKEVSLDAIKKGLMSKFELLERTNLLLQIHCPSIPRRGGKQAVLKEIGNLIGEKVNTVKSLRDLYLKYSEPDGRVNPELELYLEQYRRRRLMKTKDGRLQLEKFTLGFIEKNLTRIKPNEEDPDDTTYRNKSQYYRNFSRARQIIKNVERGVFPGKYK